MFVSVAIINFWYTIQSECFRMIVYVRYVQASAVILSSNEVQVLDECAFLFKSKVDKSQFYTIEN